MTNTRRSLTRSANCKECLPSTVLGWSSQADAASDLLCNGHFAHEERLMRAARYGSMRWHKQSHDAARRRVGQFARRIEKGDTKAGLELVEYLRSWLHDHTAIADRMMAAFLRNQQRCIGKLMFQASTKPIDSCAWVDAKGNRFRPQSGNSGD